VRLEDAVLVFRRQACKQRQHLGVAASSWCFARMLGGVADFALTRQEHEDVARAFTRQLVDGIDDGFCHVLDRRSGSSLADRPVAHLDRVGAPLDLDDRCAPGVPKCGEALGVDGGRGDDQLQIRPLRQQLFQVAEQEVDVEAAFVRLVDDDRVVGAAGGRLRSRPAGCRRSSP
jgi:hypothetical protein